MMLLFFLNDTATTEIYTLSLHDALPILCLGRCNAGRRGIRLAARPRRPLSSVLTGRRAPRRAGATAQSTRNGGPCASNERRGRSEEHTSELQSRPYLVCRPLLEKKKSTM